MHIHKSRVNARHSVGLDAFLMKNLLDSSEKNQMSESMWKRRVARKKKKERKKTRHVAVTDCVPCRLWDIDPTDPSFPVDPVKVMQVYEY